jgi:hypothetical protein
MLHQGFNLLKTPSRQISEKYDEGQRPGTPPSPRYNEDDYANYVNNGMPGSPYFADDNPLQSVSAKIQEGARLGNHQYEFSGIYMYIYMYMYI